LPFHGSTPDVFVEPAKRKRTLAISVCGTPLSVDAVHTLVSEYHQRHAGLFTTNGAPDVAKETTYGAGFVDV
jgi:hypothetical protein